MNDTRSFPCQLFVLSRLISVAISVSIWLSHTLNDTYTWSVVKGDPCFRAFGGGLAAVGLDLDEL